MRRSEFGVRRHRPERRHRHALDDGYAGPGARRQARGGPFESRDRAGGRGRRTRQQTAAR
ncbi:hypothetical protein [Streptomyces sp. NPDC002209]|uniref:hypothetical protein n=1 Tax=Streptomyces sp. NPDC002209 TaxID=3364638 RepID=UPI0036975D24